MPADLSNLTLLIVPIIGIIEAAAIFELRLRNNELREKLRQHEEDKCSRKPIPNAVQALRQLRDVTPDYRSTVEACDAADAILAAYDEDSLQSEVLRDDAKYGGC